MQWFFWNNKDSSFCWRLHISLQKVCTTVQCIWRLKGLQKCLLEEIWEGRASKSTRNNYLCKWTSTYWTCWRNAGNGDSVRWEHCEVCSRELKKEETSNYVNDTGLRSQKQNLRADYIINANNWKRILKCPCLHKTVPQDPPFHYCHSIPWWRSQLLLSQNSRLLRWFLEELFPAASVSQVTKTTQTSFNWPKKVRVMCNV